MPEKQQKARIAAAVPPAILREIKRRAARRGEGHCELARKILEAWAQNMMYCDVCNFPHPQEHKHHPHGVGL